MPIRVVDAKQALEDIRSGMDDNALMQKYRISSLHLEQLFGKLELLNVLKRLPAWGLLKDMRAGLNDANLMAKYHLSAAALQNVFSEMIRNGLILQSSELSPVREKETHQRQGNRRRYSRRNDRAPAHEEIRALCKGAP